MKAGVDSYGQKYFCQSGWVVVVVLLLSSCTENPADEGVYHFESNGNPIVTHIRVADPDCHVWNGKLWMYTSQDHDSDSATLARVGHGYSRMDGYHVFSTEDMKHWTDHGEILHSRDVEWGTDEGGWMWAPGAAYKNGTYYLYFPHKDKSMQWRIGVATSKKPDGPFTPEPTYMEGTDGIDPVCFVDDDGQAYLYFNHAKVARLKDNMLELAEEPRLIDYGSDNFGEGSYLHKYKGRYYYSYTDYKNKEDQGYYAIGDSPYGPFEFKGAINGKPPWSQDHHSIVELKGQWYYFYHIGDFVDANGVKGNHTRRNVSVDYLYYNDDGTIQRVIQTKEGVAPLQ